MVANFTTAVARVSAPLPRLRTSIICESLTARLLSGPQHGRAGLRYRHGAPDLKGA